MGKGGSAERRYAGVVAVIDVGAGIDQQGDGLRMAAADRPEQRGLALLVGNIDSGAISQQRIDDFAPISERSQV